jgi:hypothetical protein
MALYFKHKSCLEKHPGARTPTVIKLESRHYIHSHYQQMNNRRHYTQL